MYLKKIRRIYVLIEEDKFALKHIGIFNAYIQHYPEKIPGLTILEQLIH